jgi:hypothetical protein
LRKKAYTPGEWNLGSRLRILTFCWWILLDVPNQPV